MSLQRSHLTTFPPRHELHNNMNMGKLADLIEQNIYLGEFWSEWTHARLRHNEMLRSHVFARFNWSAIRFGKCNLSDNQCRKTRDKESTRNGIHCNRERIDERLAQLSTVLPRFLYLFPQLQGEGKKWEGQIRLSPHLPFQHTGNRDFSKYFFFLSHQGRSLRTPPSLLSINAMVSFPLTTFRLSLKHLL